MSCNTGLVIGIILAVVVVVVGVVWWKMHHTQKGGGYSRSRGGAEKTEVVRALVDTNIAIFASDKPPQTTNPKYKHDGQSPPCSYCRTIVGNGVSPFSELAIRLYGGGYKTANMTGEGTKCARGDEYALVVPTVHISKQWDNRWKPDCLQNLSMKEKSALLKYIEAMEQEALKWANDRLRETKVEETAKIAKLTCNGQHYELESDDPAGTIYPFFHWPNSEGDRDGRRFDHIHLQVPLKLKGGGFGKGNLQKEVDRLKEKEKVTARDLPYMYNNITGKGLGNCSGKSIWATRNMIINKCHDADDGGPVLASVTVMAISERSIAADAATAPHLGGPGEGQPASPSFWARPPRHWERPEPLEDRPGPDPMAGVMQYTPTSPDSPEAP